MKDAPEYDERHSMELDFGRGLYISNHEDLRDTHHEMIRIKNASVFSRVFFC
jgi:hypothetical protein